MPKMNFGFDGASAEISEGFKPWDGPLPPNGSYTGTLKMAKIVPMKKNPKAKRIAILVLIDKDASGSTEYQGYPAFGGVNLTEQGIPFVNQWLRGLVKTDEEFEKIHKIFFGSGPMVDEKKVNILKIGTVKIGSPEGELKVKVSLKQEPYNGTMNSKVQAFLVPDGGSSGGSADAEDVIEDDGDAEAEEAEEDSGEAEADESIFAVGEETDEDEAEADSEEVVEE